MLTPLVYLHMFLIVYIIIISLLNRRNVRRSLANQGEMIELLREMRDTLKGKSPLGDTSKLKSRDTLNGNSETV